MVTSCGATSIRITRNCGESHLKRTPTNTQPTSIDPENFKDYFHAVRQPFLLAMSKKWASLQRLRSSFLSPENPKELTFDAMQKFLPYVKYRARSAILRRAVTHKIMLTPGEPNLYE